MEWSIVLFGIGVTLAAANYIWFVFTISKRVEKLERRHKNLMEIKRGLKGDKGDLGLQGPKGDQGPMREREG